MMLTGKVAALYATGVLILWCQSSYAWLSNELVKSASAAVRGEDVVSQLTTLAQYSDDELPAVTRLLFTPNDMSARSYVKNLMKDADLEIREDAMGNIWGTWPGSDPSLGAVATGSHCDAIPKAGMYDGTVGVVGAIAALKALRAAGFKPRRSLQVVMFTSEEPTRFGLSCLGSRAMAGALSEAELSKREDENGTTFLQAANAVGYGGPSLGSVLEDAFIRPGSLDFFVELHIEQGPLLEEKKRDIGVVTAIAAPATMHVTFQGDGGHAGGQLMPLRNDASLAAAELALAVEKHVLATGAVDTVGTVGSWSIEPNAVNSVPRVARLAIDVRDIDEKRRDGVLDAIHVSATAIAKKRKVRVSVEVGNRDPPATSFPTVTDAIRRSVYSLPGLSQMDLVSRAYHDSLFMAQIAPTAMIFIPCRNGWSHRPDEFAEPEHIANGVRVLALTMAALSESNDGAKDDKEL